MIHNREQFISHCKECGLVPMIETTHWTINMDQTQDVYVFWNNKFVGFYSPKQGGVIYKNPNRTLRTSIAFEKKGRSFKKI